MSINPTPSGSTTPSSPTDYLGMIGGLTGLPFDPNTVINSLLAADQIPIQNLQTQITNIHTNESIYKSIGTDVSSFQSIAFNLTLQSTIQANAATSSNTNALSATASPTAQAGSYSIAVTSLATATAATSTSPLGQTIDSLASSTPLSGLNLSGTPTPGTFSVVIDGAVKTITVDPTKPLIDAPPATPPQGALSQLQAAINTGIQGSDPGASATVSVSGDKVRISLSGGTGSHTMSFGAAGDSSNFLALMNLFTVQGAMAGSGSTLSSSANVGVAQPTKTLASASLATALSGPPGTTGSPSGAFSINGVSISWDAGVDSLNSIIGRINSSGAGVTAQYNSVSDQVVLTSNTTGQTAMNLVDSSGNLLTALHLAPGATTAQKLGANASITINGTTTVTSISNTITNAAPGLTLTANAVTAPGSPATVTVGPDVTNITKQVQSFVDAANKVLGDINLTQQKDPTSGTYSQLLGDPTLNGIKSQILTMLTGQLTTAGTYQSLQDIGITTGAVGSTPGTTTTLQLDTTKLSAALAANPAQVAALFNGTGGVNGFQGVAQQLNTYMQQQTNPTQGPFAQFQSTGDAEVTSLQAQIANLNTMIANQRQALVTQFTAMSTALLSLSSQSSIFANMVGAPPSSSSSSSSSSGH